jgi:hypothetical protein
MLRDKISRANREHILRKMGCRPFPHQAKVWAAFDGFLLDDVAAETFPCETVAGKPDLVPYFDLVKEIPAGFTDVLCSNDDGSWVERRALIDRPGGPATRCADLAAYKGGKSWGGGIFVASELIFPETLWDIVGTQYNTCTEEFNYVLEALFSEKGCNIPLEKPDYGGLYVVTSQNSPHTGRMRYVLSNGSHVEARSWDQSEALKGKQRDGYLYAEAYQFRGIYCFTTIKQNLDVRDGKALFATTPDDAWVEVLEELGHSEDPLHHKWFCLSGTRRDENPWTYDKGEMEADRHIMTREQHAIAYEGKTGQYVGTVFNYRRGERHFTCKTHPDWWKNPKGKPTPENLSLPDGVTVVGGADTGNFYAAGFVAFDRDGHAFVLSESCNYHYVAGQIERDEWMDPIKFYDTIKGNAAQYRARPAMLADKNSQFKADAFYHGVSLLPGTDPETRTEVARSYFQHDRIWIAPWLTILPYELEKQIFPPEESSSGAWRRMKKDDHCVDWLEHILASRSQGKTPQAAKREMFRDAFMRDRKATIKKIGGNPWAS